MYRLATAFLRTVILYLLLIAGLRLSGKRQIGELEPIELVLTLLISDLASVPMQDFALPLFNGVIPIITLIALPLLWIGFFHSLFTGNEGNMSSYSLVILMFSLLNADVLIKGEKLSNKVLDVLAKTNCVLLFLWAAATIVHVLVK